MLAFENTQTIATRKFTEEQHKVLEELLCDIRKNPTISDKPRAQYLVDFFLEIKSNPILYKSFHRQDVTVTPTPFNTALAESTTNYTTSDVNVNNNNNTMVPITLLGDALPDNTPREDFDYDNAKDDDNNNCDSYDNIDDDEDSFGSVPDNEYNLSDSFPSSTESPTANQPPNDNIGLTKIDGNESFGIFDIPLLNDFVCQATLHSAQCSAPMELVSVNKRMGAGIVESWRCSACQQLLVLHNCKSVTTSVKERGRIIHVLRQR
jgi:hypothetical protein